MNKTFFIAATTFFAFFTAQAANAQNAPFSPRGEINTRLGTERAIVMTELWAPFYQDASGLFYGDLRLMGDDQDNNEWNLGIGRRWLTADAKSILGLHGWLDRRETDLGSVFYQLTGGYEYLGDNGDLRINAYLPLSGKEKYTTPAAFSTTPYLAGTGIFVDTTGLLVETPMKGIDAQWTIPLRLPFVADGALRASVGGFVFSADDADSLQGGRLRLAYDVNNDIELGLRMENDNIRGSQGFAEATIRFPFGSKASARTLGLRGRLDESPERDIDIITGSTVTKGKTLPVLNVETGQAQRVFYVDNRATGGDGSVDNPFATLAAANAAANGQGDIIYVNTGDGTVTGHDHATNLAQKGQTLLGEGSAFVYDNGRFTIDHSNPNFNGVVLRAAAATAPVLTNSAGPGVTVAADDVTLAGFTVRNAQGTGILVDSADGALIKNITIDDPTGGGINARSQVAGSRSVTISGVKVDQAALGIQVTTTSGTWENVHIEDVEISQSTNRGIIVNSGAGGHIGTVVMRDITTHNNGQQGVLIRANGGDIDHVDVDGVKAYNNTDATSGNGFQLEATGTTLASATLRNIEAYDNRMGINLLAQSGGTLGDITLADSQAYSNNAHGLWLRITQASQITRAHIDNLSATDNNNDGVNISPSNSASVWTSIENGTFTENNRGIYIADNSTGTVVTDLGGGTLGSTGNNRIFGNTTRDLRGDLGGETVDAQNNWWGNVAGPQAGQIQIVGGGSFVTVPFLDEDPLAP